MDALNIIQWVVSGIGAITGVAGLTIAAFDYFRDSAKIIVTLTWDMAIFNSPAHNPKELYGVVNVTNIGRRPIYITHAHLYIEGFKDHVLLLADGIKGTKLAEGDQPAQYMIKYDENFLNLIQSHKWDKVFAVVQDSTQNNFKSKKVKRRPSWAKDKT